MANFLYHFSKYFISPAIRYFYKGLIWPKMVHFSYFSKGFATVVTALLLNPWKVLRRT